MRRRDGRVLAVCRAETGAVRIGAGTVETAIDKRPVAGPVAVDAHGLAGDVQVDRTHHGGPDQALYAYAEREATHFAEAFARPLPPGSFGENLRLENLDVSGALVGERWRIGTQLEVVVTAPRIPCRVFAAFLDIPDLIARFLSAGRPGAYLRVEVPGMVEVGDAVRVLHRPTDSLSVAEVSRIHTTERDRAAELLALEDVAVRVRAWAEAHLAGTTGTGAGATT